MLFRSVYHFGAPAASPQDSTGYKTEPSAFKAVVNPASLIASGAQFKGAETITVPSTPALHLAPAQGLTVSAWVRIEAAQTQADLVALQESGKELVLGINGTQAFANLTGMAVTQTGGNLTTGEWHHLVARAGNGRLDLFVEIGRAHV